MTEKSHLTAEEKLRKARIRIMTQQPFFASLIMLLKPVEDESIITMGTDSKHLFYAPSFIEKLSVEEIIFIYLHEILHCTLGHIWRQRNKNHMLWNVATDYAINDILKNMSINNFLKMPAGVLYHEMFAGMSAEAIYDLLLIFQTAAPQIPAKDKHSVVIPDDNTQQSGVVVIPDGNTPQGGSSAMPSGNTQQGGATAMPGGNTPQGGATPYQVTEPQNHNRWKEASDKEWVNWQYNTKVAINNSQSYGDIPEYLTEIIKHLKPAQKDWRVLLNEFIQEEINDFSLMPPDNRFDGDFFIFSFSDTTEVVKDLLFFVDTSASMEIKDLEACYSEINGAIQQFNRQLQGKLAFFDVIVHEPLYDFENITDIRSIRPVGRGGTWYYAIFDFLEKYKDANNPVAGVIIITDGVCTYDEIVPPDFPVLWVFTTHDNAPPFGLYTTIEVS